MTVNVMKNWKGQKAEMDVIPPELGGKSPDKIGVVRAVPAGFRLLPGSFLVLSWFSLVPFWLNTGTGQRAGYCLTWLGDAY